MSKKEYYNGIVKHSFNIIMFFSILIVCIYYFSETYAETDASNQSYMFFLNFLPILISIVSVTGVINNSISIIGLIGNKDDISENPICKSKPEELNIDATLQKKYEDVKFAKKMFDEGFMKEEEYNEYRKDIFTK